MVRAKTRFLVLGGSGGVGSVAIQFARSAGLVVSATCSESNAAWVRRLGPGSGFADVEMAGGAGLCPSTLSVPSGEPETGPAGAAKRDHGARG